MLNKKALSRLLFLIAFVFLILFSTGPLPLYLGGLLETRYEVFNNRLPDSLHAKVHILVLGGGHASDPLLPATNQISTEALGRLVEGIRLQRMHPESLLVLSGYSGNDPVSNAEVMFRAALILGVEPQKMATIPEPQNTRQEAIFYLNRYGKDHQLILVTSATHVPRAMIWFRKAGLNPVPAPTNHLIKRSSQTKIRWWLPSTNFIELSDRAIYEYAGIVQAIMIRKI
ncbi:MAG TPA: ElyC/SanA/YdcF family protein [Bacteroidales bacterium]|nr:ElyC/SanA/YdcF family protein [Bacteroidales bacterium]